MNQELDSSKSKENEIQEKFVVLVNHEEQYSLWPHYKDIPLGWKIAKNQSTKEECLKYVYKVWTDMRPLSLRKEMDK